MKRKYKPGDKFAATVEITKAPGGFVANKITVDGKSMTIKSKPDRWQLNYSRKSWLQAHHRSFGTLAEAVKEIEGLAEDEKLNICLSRYSDIVPAHELIRQSREEWKK